MWTVRLTNQQRDALAALLRDGDELDPTLAAVLEEVELARWDDLPHVALPWARVSELASAQGIDEADVVWDLCGGMAPRGPDRGRVG